MGHCSAYRGDCAANLDFVRLKIFEFRRATDPSGSSLSSSCIELGATVGDENVMCKRDLVIIDYIMCLD